MKTLVIYYSYMGNTAQLASNLAAKVGADLYEIKDKSRPSKAGVMIIGCFKAMRGKPSPILPIEPELDAYEKIIIMSPIWAGNIVPPIMRLFELLPSGKQLEVIASSASGKSKSKNNVTALLNSRGCKSARYKDIKAR